MSANALTLYPGAIGGRAVFGLPKAIVAAFLAVTLVSAGIIVFWDQFAVIFAGFCSEHLSGIVGEKCEAGLNKFRIYGLAFGLLPIIWLLEAWRPANPEQPVFSPGMLVDFVWFLLFPVLALALRGPFERLLETLFGASLADFHVPIITALPVAVQIVVIILLVDLLTWVSHWIRHKVPLFWEFHKIHHSQQQLNFFSTLRLHPGDFLANALIRFLPFTLLGLETGIPAYLVWLTVLRIYEMFVHSNIRTDLGPLRYVLVTPQSHRVHHSIEPEHVDLNFGNFFSIWDFLFRTQCLDFKAYPRLGVTDGGCPSGMATTLTGSVRVVIRELIYPFQAIGRLVLRR
jgi:sterol desaturase/sphingolipid hydroxylase (fatty acid hydroxylase superfamily)